MGWRGVPGSVSPATTEAAGGVASRLRGDKGPGHLSAQSLYLGDSLSHWTGAADTTHCPYGASRDHSMRLNQVFSIIDLSPYSRRGSGGVPISRAVQ